MYEYLPLGSLEDLLVDYFRNEKTLQKTLKNGLEDTTFDKRQLYNLSLQLGAELCEIAMELHPQIGGAGNNFEAEFRA